MIGFDGSFKCNDNKDNAMNIYIIKSGLTFLVEYSDFSSYPERPRTVERIGGREIK